VNIDLERIRKIARRLFEKYDSIVPIDLDAILSDCCEYIEDDSITIDGYTELDCWPPRMVVRSNGFAPQRKRFKEKILSTCRGYTHFELSIDDIGVIMFVRAPHNAAPIEHSKTPNELLRNLVMDVYENPDVGKGIMRRINGIVGGINNRKDKGERTLELFYDEIFHRMSKDEQLCKILNHPSFPGYLKGKLISIM